MSPQPKYRADRTVADREAHGHAMGPLYRIVDRRAGYGSTPIALVHEQYLDKVLSALNGPQ